VGGRRPIDERAATRQYNEYGEAPHSAADSSEAAKLLYLDIMAVS